MEVQSSAAVLPESQLIFLDGFRLSVGILKKPSADDCSQEESVLDNSIGSPTIALARLGFPKPIHHKPQNFTASNMKGYILHHLLSARGINSFLLFLG